MKLNEALSKGTNSSKYKNVYFQKSQYRSVDTNVIWTAKIVRNGKHILCKGYLDEKAAAKAVDLVLINLGEKPVNGFYTKKD